MSKNSKLIWPDITFPAINLWNLHMSNYNAVTGDALVSKVGDKAQQERYSSGYDRIFKTRILK